MQIDIRSPKIKDEFDQYYQLRYDVLRKPWDRPFSTNRDELDDSAIHIAAFIDKEVVGCARLQFNNSQEAQLRYMAVKENYRKQGIGKLLLEEAKKIAKEKDANYIVLNARETALDFYKNNGYKIIEKGELLFDSIQHWKMKIDL